MAAHLAPATVSAFEISKVSSAANPVSEDAVIELSRRVDFNMHDAYYEHATAEHFWIQWRFAVLQKLIGRYDLGQKIMEVGCGNGVVQHQFETAYDRPVFGCDLNRRAMEMGGASRGNRYLYNVLDRREQWRNAFNSVLMLDVLEHIDEPFDFLKAVRSHLMPNGMLVINVPATPWLYSRYDEVQGHVRRYTTERLEFELQKSGFRLVANQYWGANIVPVAVLRKQLVRRADKDDVLTKGFAPPSRFAERILRGLMALEMKGLRIPRCGTSLAAVAIRDELPEGAV